MHSVTPKPCLCVSPVFARSPYQSHGADRGYNAIGFANCANIWVNQVGLPPIYLVLRLA